MTENPIEDRRRPKRDAVDVAELVMLVHVPGQPAAVRAFTATERAEAETYALDNMGTIEDLPT